MGLLRDHYAAGRITLDELAERAESALQARTHADLDVVTADLVLRPAPAPPTEHDAPTRRRSSTVRIGTTGNFPWTLAVLSSQRRRGRWRVGEETGALAIMGSCQLDLREAQLPPGGRVQINAVSIMGSIDILVPEGVQVDLDGFALMGANECRTSQDPIPGLPVVRVQAFSLMGNVVVRSPKRRGREFRTRQDTAELTHRESRDEQREAMRDARDQWRSMGRELGEEIREQIGRLRDEIEPSRRADGGFDVDQLRTRLPDAVRSSIDALATWATRERPDLRANVAPDGTVTILFTDIESFTEMTERLGDRQAREVLGKHNAIVEECVLAHDGSVVKSVGDGFMLSFRSARRALRCARAIQQEFDRYSTQNRDIPIRVRIGVHTGEAIRERAPDGTEDYYGKNVNLAARIGDLAAGGEILASSIVYELTLGSGEFSFGSAREIEIRGLSGTYRVYDVAWRTGDSSSGGQA